MDMAIKTAVATLIASVAAVLLNKLLFGPVDTWQIVKSAAIFAVIFLLVSLIANQRR